TNTSPTTQSSSPFTPNLQHFIIIKLTPTNYLLWKTQLTPIHKTYNLLDLVTFNDPCPPTMLTSPTNFTESTPNLAYISWCHWINVSLSKSILPLVVGKNTFVEAWNSLSQAFGAPSHTRPLQLHMQLRNLKKNDSPISTYLQRAKYIFDELAVVGKIPSPEEFNAII
ncbi:UBN2_3 domain-containing protein, partial [Cephalotus follicularis]